MKKTVIIILSLLLLSISLVVLTGCGEDDKRIIGSWKNGDYIFTFNNDKTGSYNAGGFVMNFTYETKDDKVTILYTGNTKASESEYKIYGDKLVMKDSFGTDVEYNKN